MTTLIYQQATYIYDWGFASAIAVIFMVFTMILANAGRLYDVAEARRLEASGRFLREAMEREEAEDESH